MNGPNNKLQSAYQFRVSILFRVFSDVISAVSHSKRKRLNDLEIYAGEEKGDPRHGSKTETTYWLSRKFMFSRIEVEDNFLEHYAWLDMNMSGLRT